MEKRTKTGKKPKRTNGNAGVSVKGGGRKIGESRTPVQTIFMREKKN